jgi:hypothetical protein
MATITPARASVAANIESITWTNLSTADTATGMMVMGAAGAIGAMMVTGTFGSATITLQGSNDGTNFYAITDPAGNDVAVTAAGIVDFSTAAAYIRPASSGGTADDVTVTVVLRS